MSDLAETGADWRIYRGTGEVHDGVERLPVPPPWRDFRGGAGDRSVRHHVAARSYQVDEQAVDLVNAALYLRRPLLVTGKPGTGKSSLAYSIAHELNLGRVLYWPVTSRSTLRDALYRYDAVGRFQELNAYRAEPRTAAPDIGRYLQLGPLGTALLPGARPRVLLIDEFDKSDVDLPNDLLNVFEEGEYVVPELARLPDDQEVVEVMTDDPGSRAAVSRGRVRCQAFPVVVVTSNGEREFPAPFLRRCLRLGLIPPDTERLARIVAAHLGEDALENSRDLIREFLHRREEGDLATDQLLNAIYLVTARRVGSTPEWDRLLGTLLRTLDGTGR